MINLIVYPLFVANQSANQSTNQPPKRQSSPCSVSDCAASFVLVFAKMSDSEAEIDTEATTATPPSQSAESERQFSRAKRVQTPWRSRMGFKSMQATLCLKAWYQNDDLFTECKTVGDYRFSR